MNVPRTHGRRSLLLLCVALLFLLPQACDDREQGGRVVIDDRELSREGPAGGQPGDRSPSDWPGTQADGPGGGGYEGYNLNGWQGRGIPSGAASAGGPGGRGGFGGGPGGPGDTQSGDTQPGGQEAAHPLFGPKVTVTFTTKDSEASAIAEAGLILFALPEDEFDPEGAPLKESDGPLFQWVRASQKFQWPASVEVRLPTDPALRLLAIVDVDGNGRLSSGDYFSKPLSVAEVTGEDGSTVSFPIERVLAAASETPFP